MAVEVKIKQKGLFKKKIEIEDKGYKDGKGGRGKLILDTKIMIPKKPNEEELNLFKKMEKMSKFNPRIS